MPLPTHFARFFNAVFATMVRNKFFVLFVVIYCAILVAFSRYAPNLDDIWMWIRIVEGKMDEVYMGFRPQIGRFWVLGLVELPLLAKISTSPYLFFAFNALLFALFSAIFLKILNLSNGKSALNALATALLSLSVGFVIVFFGICYAEKIQIIWLSIFMLCTFFTLQKPTPKNQLFGIIALNIALYYKEPTFIAAFAVGVILLISALQNRNGDLQKYALCVICSSCYFVILYYWLVFGEIDKTYSALVAKGIFALLWEYVKNDGIIVFCVGGMVLFRAYCVVFKREKIEAFFDGFLVASFAYFGAFVVLKMYAPYYLLPCFVLGIPSLLYFWRKYWRNIFVKIILFLGLFGFFAQNLPSGIHKIIDLKAQGVQFHRTLNFVAQYLRENDGANLYFEGIGRGRQIYDFETEMRPFWFAEYLEKIHKISNFDLRTEAPNGADFRPNVTGKYTLSNSDILSEPKSGDLIIVSNKSTFGDALRRANTKGELIFQSGFPTIPNVALMSFVRYFSAKWLKSEKSGNYFAKPLESYVFRVF